MGNKLKVSLAEWGFILMLLGQWIGYMLFMGWFKYLFCAHDKHYMVMHFYQNDTYPKELRNEIMERVPTAGIIRVITRANIISMSTSYTVISERHKYKYNDWNCTFKVIK